MSESIWPTIHAERKALAADLSGLTDAQWVLATMCGEWNVHDVLAHQLSLATMTTPKFFAKLAGSGFNFNNYTAKEVVAGTALGPAATLAAFVAAEPNETTPPGPKETWLGEVFVHGEDIRRPLGITRDYPPNEVARAIAFYAGSNVIIGGKSRVAGVTMKATDTDFSVGAGPLLEGPAISLLLVASGRKVALDELSGPGVEVLRERP
jgi:uncharacterized protein (TIGR03083 family)